MCSFRSVDVPHELTLLDLVIAVGEESDSESEVVAVVKHLLQTGQVRLTGAFREHPEYIEID